VSWPGIATCLLRRVIVGDALRWTKLDERAWAHIREFLPPVRVLRTMPAAYDSTQQMVALLAVGEDTEIGNLSSEMWNALESPNFEGAADKFVAAAWQQPDGGDPVSGAAGGRYGRYLVLRRDHLRPLRSSRLCTGNGAA
jgi:hypothetical protein